MTGSLLNSTKAGFSPEGVLPHESTTRPRAKALVPPTRLRRVLNVWKAAANAYRERESAWLALHQHGDCKLNSKRIYRGPIDDALERAARLRQRRRLKQS